MGEPAKPSPNLNPLSLNFVNYRRRSRQNKTIVRPTTTPIRSSGQPELLANTWGPKRELNSRPTHYECVALPTELFGRGRLVYWTESEVDSDLVATPQRVV